MSVLAQNVCLADLETLCPTQQLAVKGGTGEETPPPPNTGHEDVVVQ